MNSSRLIASVGGYFVSASEDTVAFHLYGGISTTVTLADTKVSLRETSTYPWSGDIRIEISPESPADFTVKLRLPGWAKGATASVNGEPVDADAGATNGYLAIKRSWQKSDRIELTLPMPPERIYAHPAVKENVGRVALKRGPLVYCVEETDNPGGRVQQLELPRGSEIAPLERGDLFDGIVVLSARAERVETEGWEGSLYRSEPPMRSESQLTAVPYYLWNNRKRGSMQVWICESC
jgi:DUF1680 family protein